MTRTIVSNTIDDLDDVSLAFSTLDSGDPCNVPLHNISARTTMGPAGGLTSTVSDLEKYHRTLLRSWNSQMHTSQVDPRVEHDSALFGEVS
jgi:hypothetical protein